MMVTQSGKREMEEWYKYRIHLVSDQGNIKKFNGKEIISKRILVDGKYVTRRNYVIQAFKDLGEIDTLNHFVAFVSPTPVRGAPKRSNAPRREDRDVSPELFRKYSYLVETIDGEVHTVWNLKAFAKNNGISYGALQKTISNGSWTKEGYRATKQINGLCYKQIEKEGHMTNTETWYEYKERMVSSHGAVVTKFGRLSTGKVLKIEGVGYRRARFVLKALKESAPTEVYEFYLNNYKKHEGGLIFGCSTPLTYKNQSAIKDKRQYVRRERSKKYEYEITDSYGNVVKHRTIRAWAKKYGYNPKDAEYAFECNSGVVHEEGYRIKKVLKDGD